jgi:hypothetical protein
MVINAIIDSWIIQTQQVRIEMAITNAGGK